MGRIIAISNQKGGVGKTTTTLNLGAALADMGLRVLLVDLDSQANLTKAMGCNAESLEESMYAALTDDDVRMLDILQETQWDGLHVAPSNGDVSGAEVEMVDLPGRESRLKQKLAGLDEWYDYIFIDCGPSLSLLTVNAMNAARELIVPVQAQPFALDGLDSLYGVYQLVRQQMNPDLVMSGVVITMFDTRTNVSRRVVQRLRDTDHFSHRILDTMIRVNIRLAESQEHQMPVIHFDSACHGARAYRALAYEVDDMDIDAVRAEENGEATEDVEIPGEVEDLLPQDWNPLPESESA